MQAFIMSSYMTHHVGTTVDHSADAASGSRHQAGESCGARSAQQRPLSPGMTGLAGRQGCESERHRGCMIQEVAFSIHAEDLTLTWEAAVSLPCNVTAMVSTCSERRSMFFLLLATVERVNLVPVAGYDLVALQLHGCREHVVLRCPGVRDERHLGGDLE